MTAVGIVGGGIGGLRLGSFRLIDRLPARLKNRML
jgi:hypothetical protein